MCCRARYECHRCGEELELRGFVCLSCGNILCYRCLLEEGCARCGLYCQVEPLARYLASQPQPHGIP